jgi:hypothetical protein
VQPGSVLFKYTQAAPLDSRLWDYEDHLLHAGVLL